MQSLSAFQPIEAELNTLKEEIVTFYTEQDVGKTLGAASIYLEHLNKRLVFSKAIFNSIYNLLFAYLESPVKRRTWSSICMASPISRTLYLALSFASVPSRSSRWVAECL